MPTSKQMLDRAMDNWTAVSSENVARSLVRLAEADGKTAKVEKRGGEWGVVQNPAKSRAQYRLAQAVLSGKSDKMPVKVARDMVGNPGKYNPGRKKSGSSHVEMQKVLESYGFRRADSKHSGPSPYGLSMKKSFPARTIDTYYPSSGRGGDHVSLIVPDGGEAASYTVSWIGGASKSGNTLRGLKKHMIQLYEERWDQEHKLGKFAKSNPQADDNVAYEEGPFVVKGFSTGTGHGGYKIYRDGRLLHTMVETGRTGSRHGEAIEFVSKAMKVLERRGNPTFDSLKDYTEIGYYEKVPYSEKHPSGGKYHKLESVYGLTNGEARDRAKQVAKDTGKSVFLIGRGSPDGPWGPKSNPTLSTKPYSDYYIFQMNDGRWHIAPKTEHQWNGKPDLPREYDQSYATEREAKAALSDAVSRATGKKSNPVNSDEGQRAFEAGKAWVDRAHESGVANARVVDYGFSKWWNAQAPGALVSTKKYLEKSFREGYAAEKRKGNPSIFDYEDAKRAGKERLKEYEKQGIRSYQLHSGMALNEFTIWWDNGGKEIASPSDRPGNQKAFTSTFRPYVPKGQRKGNPEPDAARMYEVFHGVPSEETLEYVEEEHYHQNVAALGTLVELRVILETTGKEVNIDFSDAYDGQTENPGGLVLIQDLARKEWAFTLGGQYGGAFKSMKERDAAVRKALDKKFGPVQRAEDIKKQHERAVRFIAKYKQASLPAGPARALYPTPYDRQRVERGAALVDKYRAANGKKKKGPIGQATETVGMVTGAVSKPLDQFMNAAGRVGGYVDGLMVNPGISMVLGGSNALLKRQLTKLREDGFTLTQMGSARLGTHHSNRVVKIEHPTMPVDQIKAHVRSIGGRVHKHSQVYNPAIPAITTTAPGPTFLTSNESGTQLYFIGGDQSLDLPTLKITGKMAEKELITIGELTHVTYHTRKKFDGKLEEYDYIHKLSEDSLKRHRNAPLPTVIYDRLNKKLLLSGGSYFIEKPFLGTSPGLED